MMSKKISLILISILFIQSITNVVYATNENDATDEITVEDDPSSDEVTEENSQTELIYRTPEIEEGRYALYEHFDDEQTFKKKWIKSSATKGDSNDYKYDGKWELTASNARLKGDGALSMQSEARHHAIGAKLDEVFKFDGRNLVLQYEVQFRKGQECGGAYIKLLSSPAGDLNTMNDKTPYTIMFGPDKCGNDYKLHFIFMHKNPINGTLREIHWSKAANVNKLDEAIKDGKWHLFRLTIRPDNSFEVIMDKRVVGKGSLLSDFNPSVNPPKEIDDPSDTKPEDWDEREKIADPDAIKPDDWNEDEPRKIPDKDANKPSDWLEDEPENIPDPDATKPSDWDPEMDGEWEPPLITNPKCAKVSGCGKWEAPLVDNPRYKGKWRPPMISNPNYKGKWSPRKIANPDFFEDLTPYKMNAIDAVAFELWTISNEIIFDNILLTDDVDVANYILDTTYQVKKDLIDEETDNWILKQIKYINKNPWLWAVYLLLFAIPLLLFIGYCCYVPGKHARSEAKPATTADKDETKEEQFKHGIAGDDVRPMRINEQDEQNIVEDDEGEEEEEEEEEEEGEGVDVEPIEAETEEVEVEDENEDEVRNEEEISKPRLRKQRKSRKEN